MRLHCVMREVLKSRGLLPHFDLKYFFQFENQVVDVDQKIIQADPFA